jgi:hypothetical protein
MKSSDDSEIAANQWPGAVDPIQSDRKPLQMVSTIRPSGDSARIVRSGHYGASLAFGRSPLPEAVSSSA